jgi:hypothetical protein
MYSLEESQLRMLIEELFITVTINTTEGQWLSEKTVLVDHGVDCGN